MLSLGLPQGSRPRISLALAAPDAKPWIALDQDKRPAAGLGDLDAKTAHRGIHDKPAGRYAYRLDPVPLASVFQWFSQ